MPLRERRTNCVRRAFRRCNGRASSSRCSRWLATVSGAFLFVLLVPAADQALWTNSPLAGLAQHLAGPAWARDVVAVALVGAAALLLVPAAHLALGDAEQLLQRLSVEGALSERLAFLHSRFGTPSRAIDVAAAATILVMFVSGGRVTWLAHAYAVAIVATLALKIAALVRLRRLRPAARPFQAPLNLHVGTREIPLGLMASTLLVGAGAVAMVVARDPPAIAAFALMGGLLRPLHRGRTGDRCRRRSPTTPRYSTSCPPPSSRSTRWTFVRAASWCSSAIRIRSPTWPPRSRRRATATSSS